MSIKILKEVVENIFIAPLCKNFENGTINVVKPSIVNNGLIDEEKFDKTLNILESKLPYSQENIAKIKEVKNGEVVKPFMENGKYIIVKVVKLNPSKVLDFEQAKAKATQDLNPCYS